MSHIGTSAAGGGGSAHFTNNPLVINLHFALRQLVNKSLMQGMITVFPLLLAAMPVSGDITPSRPVSRLASATVTIIQAERIASTLVRVDEPLPDRQISQRDAKPLVEFF